MIDHSPRVVAPDRRSSYRHRVSTWLAGLLLAGVLSPTQAFDSGEHERVADSALLLALAYRFRDSDASSVCAVLEDANLPDAVATLVRHCSPEPDAITYGGLVRLVDELNYPSQIFVREGTPYREPPRDLPILPESWLDLNEHFRVRHDRRGHSVGMTRFFDAVRALSYNEVHFQNDLVQQLQRLRRDALNTSGEHLYAALVSNALSDHFLQDFFSPGHLLWPRNHSHDSVAVSLHDGINQDGALFHVAVAFWESRLSPLADFVDGLSPTSDTLVQLDRYWLRRRADAETSCATGTPGDGLLAGSVREGIDCLRKAIIEDGNLSMYGDGLLSRSPAQQAMLLLVQAERIGQVLAAHAGEAFRRPPGIAEMRSFTPDYEKVIVPCPQHEFGEYRFHAEACSYFDFDDPEDDERAARIANEVFQDTVQGVLLLSGGGQASFESVRDAARYQFSFEHVPLGFMANTRRFRNSAIHKPADACDPGSFCNTGFAYGIDYVHDSEFTALGAGGRIIKAFPSINLQTSVYAKYLNYRTATVDDRLLSAGLRFDWGFSIGSLYIAVGREYYVDDTGDLDGTLMASFGLGIGVPQSRIRKWAVDNARYRPGEDLSIDDESP